MPNFFFSESRESYSDKKINLRQLAKIATEWEHPCFPLYNIFANKNFEEKYGHNILNVSKKQIEALAIGLVATVLKKDTNRDWWYYIFPEEHEAPDGLIITLDYKNNSYKGQEREVEVVQYRNSEISLFDQIEKKVKTAYTADTIIVCYILKGGQYDLQDISKRLMENKKANKRDVFIIYNGIRSIPNQNITEDDFFKITLVQLTPKFTDKSIDIRESIQVYEELFRKGEEARRIVGKKIYPVTRNPEFQ